MPITLLGSSRLALCALVTAMPGAITTAAPSAVSIPRCTRACSGRYAAAISGSAIAPAGRPEEVAHPATDNRSGIRTRLEWNLVIQFVTLEAGRGLAGAAASTALAAIPAIQHGQFAAEILQ